MYERQSVSVKRTYTVSLHKDKIKKMRDMANKRGTTISALTEDAVGRFLRQEEGKTNDRE